MRVYEFVRCIMISTIFSTIAVFLGSSIEEIPIFVLLFSRSKRNNKYVTLGILIDNLIIIGASLLIARFIVSLSNESIIGLFGLIPLGMGVAIALGFEEDESGKLNKLMDFLGDGGLVISTALITAAMGDDVAVYVPFFLALSIGQGVLSFLVIMVLVFLQCMFWVRIYQFKPVAEFLDKYQRVIVPLAFIPLDVYIMWKFNVVGLFG